MELKTPVHYCNKHEAKDAAVASEALKIGSWHMYSWEIRKPWSWTTRMWWAESRDLKLRSWYLTLPATSSRHSCTCDSSSCETAFVSNAVQAIHDSVAYFHVDCNSAEGRSWVRSQVTLDICVHTVCALRTVFTESWSCSRECSRDLRCARYVLHILIFWNWNLTSNCRCSRPPWTRSLGSPGQGPGQSIKADTRYFFWPY